MNLHGFFFAHFLPIFPYFCHAVFSANFAAKKREWFWLHNQPVAPAISICGGLICQHSVGFIRVCTIFIAPPQQEHEGGARPYIWHIAIYVLICIRIQIDRIYWWQDLYVLNLPRRCIMWLLVAMPKKISIKRWLSSAVLGFVARGGNALH